MSGVVSLKVVDAIAKPFTTITRVLLACKDSFGSQKCTHVALESIGVCWKPVFNLLEETMGSFWQMPEISRMSPVEKPT
jgi:hypothetical protein